MTEPLAWWQEKLMKQVMLAAKQGKRIVLVSPPRSRLPSIWELMDDEVAEKEDRD